MNKRGVSLIEVLIGIILISLASLATLTYFAYAKGNVAKTGNRRAALERARQRLEQLMAADITAITPANPCDPVTPNVTCWLKCAGNPCAWSFFSSVPGTPETMSVEDVGDQPVETTVTWIDDLSSAGTRNVLELSAKVWFTPGDNTDDDFHRVFVKTLRTP